MCNILKPLLFLIIFLLPYTAIAGKPGIIVVTIKPLYSLLAHLTDGITQPVLLFEQLPSAHHYNLRPSQRSLLANAGMIVWVGPQMESYLEKILQQTADATIVSALSSDGLQLLPKRSEHAHGGDHAATGSGHNIDPHIWLSTDNALAISRHLASSLMRFDPPNRETYRNNLRSLSARIRANADLMKKALNTEHREYIAYHDAFQYAEHELGLEFVDAVSFDENAGTSLKHAREIAAKINHRNIHCLVYQAPKPAIISRLQSQTSINVSALDPLGLKTNNSRQAWFELMQQLAVNFNQCLSAPVNHQKTN